MSTTNLAEPLSDDARVPEDGCDTPLLQVDDLRVSFETVRGSVQAVRGISFDLKHGETLAIVGESGSGKSQAVMALMGLLPRNGRASGRALFGGEDLLALDARALDRVRGAKIAMIFQEPMTSLDPLYRIGHLMALPLMRHLALTKAQARTRSIDLLARVGIRDPETRIDAYAHEFSADEPTTALDATVARRILDMLDELKRDLGLSIILISHDLNSVRRSSDRVAVMAEGKIVELSETGQLFRQPKADETRRLIHAEPRGMKAPVTHDAPLLLEAERVTVEYPGRARLFGRRPEPLRAVDEVSITLRQGETLGVVGESGSGKSTLGRALLRLVPASGMVRFEDRALMPLSRNAMRPLRRDLQVVFQDPYGALSPRLTVGEIVAEGLRVHAPGLSADERTAAVSAMLADVGLDPQMRSRFPHELSGGQRQRIAIARAMILKPKLVVLDEPTSALDRSVQADIVDLLRDLQRAHRLAYLFISHDLAVVRAMADRILVLKDGRVVEEGSVDEITRRPRTPYTQELMAAAFVTGCNA
jgi:oligopeptide transport system ATP-binding protein